MEALVLGKGRLPVFDDGRLPVFDPFEAAEDEHGDEPLPLPSMPPNIEGAELSKLKVCATRLTKPQKQMMTAKPMMLQSRYMPRSLFSLLKKK